MVEKYLWADLTTLLAIYDKDDNVIQRFEYADQRMPVSMTQNGTKYYLHYDQVGSLRAVSDISGNVIKEITYDTYGTLLSDSNEAFKVPFGFAGGLYDSDTTLTRFGYRDYDAYTGKWTAKDPIGFDGGDSNLYGYVLGDPVNFVDPMGLKKYWEDLKNNTEDIKNKHDNVQNAKERYEQCMKIAELACPCDAEAQNTCAIDQLLARQKCLAEYSLNIGKDLAKDLLPFWVPDSWTEPKKNKSSVK